MSAFQFADHVRPVRGEVVISLAGSGDDVNEPGIRPEDAAIRGARAHWQEVARTSNLVVNTGYGVLARFLASSSSTAIDPPRHVAVGTAVSAIAGSNASLGFEILRRPLSSAAVLSTYSVRLATMFLGAEALGSLTEIGLFTATAAFLPGDGSCIAGSGTTTVATGVTTWTENQWAGWTVSLTSGTGKGLQATITGNAASTGVITINTTWNAITGAGTFTAPALGDGFAIGGASQSATNPSAMVAMTQTYVTKASSAMSIVWTLTLPSS